MADITVTAANVAPSSSTTEEGTAGGTVTAGQPVYKDSSDSYKLKAADANASAAAAAAVGIALHASLAGQPLRYAKAGPVTIGATVAVGTIYVVSATAGGIAPHGDLATGMYTTILGVATTTGIITMPSSGPIVSGVAVP